MATEIDAIYSDVWKQFMQVRMKVMAICGIAGVGKTTFLKHICNYFAFPSDHFDHVIWVTVSRNLSMEKVQDDIWKSIGDFDPNWLDKTFDQKSQSLARVLRRKKFVLALDDLSEPIDLHQLGVPIPQEHEEWKVIFTTRSQQLCFQMKSQVTVIMNNLRPAHAWNLFKSKIGENLLVDDKFIHLAKLIANECEGLPLLIRAVARAMASRTTFQEWKDAFKKVLSFKQENYGVSGQLGFDLLNFCFDSLPDSRTKSCFFYYSLFPEDYTILKIELIDFWICEKLLGHHQDALSLGYRTVDTLVRACLLEEEDGEESSVKLLDLIRDAALQKTFKSQMFKNAQLGEATEARDLETVGWIVPMRDSIRNLACVPHNLFNFLLKHNPFIIIKGEISQFMDALTVLVLSNSGIEKVPQEVSRFVSLQYLNLSHTWIASLPIELRMLKKLKCLNLEHDCELRVVPKQLISSLSALKVLKMFRCGFSVEESTDNILCVRNMDLDSLLCLEHLEVLSITITCTRALHKFFSNPNLTTCTQSLSLEVFWGTKSLDISPFLAMKNLLTLEIHQAEKLRKFNDNMHITETKFERLQDVTIESCSRLQELTWIALAPHLVVLTVKNCEQMKEIVARGELGDILMEPFPKLKYMELESLPELRSICWKALPFECLEKIKIVECSLLRQLPLNSDSAKENKMEIEAEEKWWKDVEWEDDATKTCFEPFFQPLKLM